MSEPDKPRADADKLVRVLDGGKRLVVFLHDNPDPDSMAAGWLLARIGEHRGMHSVIAYGGRLGRAENRTMVNVLKIPLRCVDELKLRHLKTDRYAMVDSQPKAGNNSFPDKWNAHIVIDHHPPQPTLQGDFVDVRPDEGSCTTMVLKYFDALRVPLTPQMATAVAYAIVSETQDLEREATRADREAYQRVFPLVRLQDLGRIRHPARSREYFRTIARAMRRVMMGRHTAICHIGPVSAAEVVAEVADFLAAMERVSWTMVTGLHMGVMVLSMRTSQGRAEQVIKKTIGDLGKGGGHERIAGGAIPCASLELYEERAEGVTERFLTNIHTGRRSAEKLRRLLDEPDRPSGVPVASRSDAPKKPPTTGDGSPGAPVGQGG